MREQHHLVHRAAVGRRLCARDKQILRIVVLIVTHHHLGELQDRRNFLCVPQSSKSTHAQLARRD
jgi:hypothetical protein